MNEIQLKNVFTGPFNKNLISELKILSKNQNPGIYLVSGERGTGKTFIIKEFINEMKELSPSVRILYKKSEDFVNDYLDGVAAIATGNNAFFEDFRKYYLYSEILIIDDLHQLTLKKSSQEELVFLIEQIKKENKIVIILNDPDEFSNGKYVKKIREIIDGSKNIILEKPDKKSLLTILYNYAESHSYLIPEDTIKLIVEHIEDNNITDCITKLHFVEAYRQVSGKIPLNYQMGPGERGE